MGKGAKKWKENNRVLIMTKIPNPDYNHFLLRERGEKERKKKGGRVSQRGLGLKYSTLGHIYYLLMRKEGNVICLLVRKGREQLSSAAINRSILEKAVCFTASLNGADSAANRSKQLSKGTFMKESPQGQGAEHWTTQQRRLGSRFPDLSTQNWCILSFVAEN